MPKSLALLLLVSLALSCAMTSNYNLLVTQSVFGISGYVINDANRNGIKDADETGLSNWKITLDGAGSGTIGVQRETMTDSNGFYQFTNVEPGMYIVTEETKSGYSSVGGSFKEISVIDRDVTNLNFMIQNEGNFFQQFNNYIIPISFVFAALVTAVFLFIGFKFARQKLSMRRAPWTEVEGIARSVIMSTQNVGVNISISVLNFRVEQTDKSGSITSVAPVEMRGSIIHGNVADGDRVRVKGRLKDGIIVAKEALNLSTNSKVRTD